MQNSLTHWFFCTVNQFSFSIRRCIPKWVRTKHFTYLLILTFYNKTIQRKYYISTSRKKNHYIFLKLMVILKHYLTCLKKTIKPLPSFFLSAWVIYKLYSFQKFTWNTFYPERDKFPHFKVCLSIGYFTLRNNVLPVQEESDRNESETHILEVLYRYLTIFWKDINLTISYWFYKMYFIKVSLFIALFFESNFLCARTFNSERVWNIL